MNGQIVRLTYVALRLVAALVVMTTYWQTWAAAGLAARQDNSIRRVAEFSIDRGLIFSFEPRERLARNRERESRARRSSSAAIRTARSPRTSSATRRSGAREPGSSAR